MTTDTAEHGLECLICMALRGHPCAPSPSGIVAEPPAGYDGVGWSCGGPHDCDREHGVNLVYLLALPLPPAPEQTGIACFLDQAERRFQHYLRARQKLSARIQELRTRLVSDVATGKLDMREAAAALNSPIAGIGIAKEASP